MRIVLRIVLQFAIVFATMAAFVAASGDPRMWLILFYLIAIAVPGLLVSGLVLAPLELMLDRRGRGVLIYGAAPLAGALLGLPFMQLSGNSWTNIAAMVPIFAAVGGGWGLLWALTRPVSRLLFGPRTD